jgi:hypothetical protein
VAVVAAEPEATMRDQLLVVVLRVAAREETRKLTVQTIVEITV